MFQDRTRSSLLRGLASDLLEKNALILDAGYEEVLKLIVFRFLLHYCVFFFRKPEIYKVTFTQRNSLCKSRSVFCCTRLRQRTAVNFSNQFERRGGAEAP